ncbi:synaptogenesis protein syg-2-like isoform X2 [Tachypleus tridentatus]|uniref:synaptogenesis protein syg-2-like isoform X2 n=1 Tax=Tachypleus tridentatus TaxID=6853 RepID=UPI003FD44BCE
MCDTKDRDEDVGTTANLLLSKENVAIAGGKITLPCNITPSLKDDRVVLVLWYKDDFSKPVYTLDSRKGGIAQGRHATSDPFTGRAYFSTVDRPAVLVLDPLLPEDEGRFRCRVDFERERTRHDETYLMVVVPPRSLFITDERGEVVQSLIGPYNEGDSLLLTCEVEGGKPTPSVTWWRESVLLDDTFDITVFGNVRNKLQIDQLRRHDLMATFLCQASNTNLSVPMTSTVTIDMNFRPLTAKILGNRKPLSSGDTVELQCVTMGSRPPAEITWWKGNTELRSTKSKSFGNGNYTSSVLTIKPSSDDNGKFLTCRALNPLMLDSIVEYSLRLEVFYPPQLILRLGSKLRHTHLQEGNDVYLECNIRANPWVTEVTWKLEGRDLVTNTSIGIIVSNQSLVLQKVKRSSRGRYLCSAKNPQGYGESNVVFLRIQYAPVCKPGQQLTYGVPQYDGVEVRCQVEADPPEVKFRWNFNNSLERREIVNFETSGTESVTRFVPRNNQDFGSLLCWAANNVGMQREPCVYAIIPAGVPDPVANCSVFNQTDHTFRVQCKPGYDGGLQQHFVMEVHDTAYQRLRANMTSPIPVFLARNLPSSASFLVVVYSVNSKGRSQTKVLTAKTILNPETQAHNENIKGKLVFSPVLMMLISLAVGLIIIVITVVLVIRCRQRKSRTQKSELTEKIEKYDSPLVQKTTVSEEKCPDVIPGNNVKMKTAISAAYEDFEIEKCKTKTPESSQSMCKPAKSETNSTASNPQYNNPQQEPYPQPLQKFSHTSGQKRVKVLPTPPPGRRHEESVHENSNV